MRVCHSMYIGRSNWNIYYFCVGSSSSSSLNNNGTIFLSLFCVFHFSCSISFISKKNVGKGIRKMHWNGFGVVPRSGEFVFPVLRKRKHPCCECSVTHAKWWKPIWTCSSNQFLFFFNFIFLVSWINFFVFDCVCLLGGNFTIIFGVTWVILWNQCQCW